MRHRALSRKVTSATLVTLLVGAALTTAGAEPAMADPVTAAHAMRIVQQYQGVWTSPPGIVSGGKSVDAPLLGNGDVGVVVGGRIDNQTFYLGKNDFFSNKSYAIKPVGRMVLSVPGLAGSSYRTVQDIAKAQVDGTYTLGSSTLNTSSWMSATNGVFVTSLTLSGSTSQNATIAVRTGSGGVPTTSTSGGVLNADVSADTSGPLARVASRVIGGTSSISGNTISLTLQPGVTYTFVAGIVSNIDTASYQSSAVSLVSSLQQADVGTLNAAHRAWWQAYWARSYVEIPDKAIEKSWYGSLYLLGSASRPGKYAPGLWGPWITGDMSWRGDYHTNYNYEAPFYGALSTNHVDQAASYDKPVLDWMTRGQQLAAQNGFQGVLYPVGISPKGTSADMNLWNQKSDAAYLASNMIMRWQYTRDTSYANTVYPYLKQVALFWQNYLQADANGVYHIYNDAPQEGAAYPQTDNILSLGLVHLLFQGLIDMSAALNQDASARAIWQDRENRLAPLPTMTRNGQTVFRETSVGLDWVNDGNDIAIQAVYPGSQVGLDSPAALQTTARNTVGQLARWHGNNAPATFYAAAARVGYDPATIMSNLRTEATTYSYPNMGVHHGGGGIENLNVTTSGLNEMLLQSFQNNIRVFPTWPANTNGKFGDLLAHGNFLISSATMNNSVQYVRAVSQSGRDLTFTNPWAGQSVQVYRNGTSAGTVTGTRITIPTSVNETIVLAPAGTSLATVNQQLAQPLAGGGDTTAPTTPGTPSASGTTSSATNLSWTASTDNVGVTGYDVFQAPGTTGGTFTQIGTAPNTTFPVAGLAASSSYRFYVRARDAAGNTSANSGTVTVTTTAGGGGPVNVALNKAATGSTPCGPNEGPEKAVNGSATGGVYDKFCSLAATKFLQVDLGSAVAIQSFTVRHAGDGGEAASFNTRDFTIQISGDGTNWTTPVTVSANTANVTTHPIAATTARYVRLNVTTPTQTTNAATRIYELEVYAQAGGGGTNLAQGRPATQSSLWLNDVPGKAVDGNTNGNYPSGSVSHTNTSLNAWWQVDLGATSSVSSIAVWNRTDCCGDRLSDYWVFVSPTPFNTTLTPAQQAAQPGVWSNHQTSQANSPTTIPAGTNGRYVMVQLNDTNYLSLAELQVFS